MSGVESGQTVKVHYRGTLADGTEFDSSTGRDPMEITVGEGRVVTGIEEALIGMEPGENKTVTLAADEAYGPHRPELVQEIEKGSIPDEIDLEVGEALLATVPGGETVRLTIIDVGPETVTLDANHPLAGQDLTFELELVAIV